MQNRQWREITVERKDHKPIAGGTLHKVYCQGGEILTTFKPDIAAGLQVAKVYSVLVEQRGEFSNIIEATPAAAELFPEGPGEVPPGASPEGTLDLARAILMLAAALVAAAHVKSGRQATSQQIVDMAELFEKSIKGETGK